MAATRITVLNNASLRVEGDFEIVDASSRSLLEDLVSGDDFGACIDQLGVEAAGWRDGILLRISARGWGCEPAGDCDLRRYVHLSRAGRFATSEWTRLDWDPAKTEPLDGDVDDGCLTYPMPVRPELRDSSIVFGRMEGKEWKYYAAKDRLAEWSGLRTPFDS